MASGSTTGKPTTSDDDQGFSVSILSAAGTGRPADASGRQGRPSSSRASGKRRAAWWVGVVVASLALFAIARWQQHQRKPAAREAAVLAAAPASAPSPAAVASAPAPAQAVAATAPASAPTADVVLASAAVAAPSAPAASDSAPPRNPFEKFAVASPATPRKVAAVAPTPKPVAAAPARVPATPPRDRDAELVAALMANADAGREFNLAKPSPVPLSTAERNRFAAELRQCQQKHSTNAARDACRAQACQARGYAGRTKSCPAAVATPAPAHASPPAPHSPADTPAVSPSGPAA